jgi:hypothetical protein
MKKFFSLNDTKQHLNVKWMKAGEGGGPGSEKVMKISRVAVTNCPQSSPQLTAN